MTETSSNFRDAWDRFRDTNTLRLLQETLEWEWTRGRKEYAAFLVEIVDDAAKKHITRTIERLAGIPGVDPYPEEYWHVTIKGLGFVVDDPGKDDELSPRQVAMLGAEARRVIEGTPQFPVNLGLANAFPEVVLLEVNDGGAVAAMNRALTSELADLPVYAVDGPSFLPHISIARFSSHDGLAQLKETLAQVRAEDQAGPTFTVSEIKLIQAHLAEAAPTFDTLATYALK